MSLFAARSPYEEAWQAWNYGGGASRGEPAPRPEDYPSSGGGVLGGIAAGPREAPEEHPGAGGVSDGGWFGQIATQNGYQLPDIRTAAPAGSRTPTVSPDGSMPLSGGGQDPRAIFEQLTQGKPPTPETLNALEPELAKYGIRVVRNASGVAGKIALGGEGAPIIDVIQGAGVGGKAWQWNGGDGGGATGGGVPGYQMGSFTGGGKYPLAAVSGPGFMQPWTTPFNAPTMQEAEQSPGFQFRMGEGIKALERSAASKGTLLTGGTLKDMNAWAQNFASNEYDKIYGRALGEYQMANGIYNTNQQNGYNRLSGLADMGQQAASGYGRAVAGLTQDAGNSIASGQQASGNIWGNAIGGVGDAVGGAVAMYPWYKQAGQGGTQQMLPGMR